MDIIAGLIFILVGAAMVGFVVSPRTARSLDTFGAGFVPYRSDGWPHGVQEEEPVRFSWSAPRRSDAADEGPGAGMDGPEIIEIG